ncbi:J domain-containing protein [Geotalea sp. SG265]|uniref:J domain-containing protein n=1 Tax=Geotalea sp. SG265 TaxID=2922867 RepID=UPI001FAFDAFC|nr:J domain-containing protein [Geotalea sp. SG265]
MTYQDLQAALDILGLGGRATLKQIKARHRELVRLHHPDTGNGGDPEMIRKVNAAYGVLQEYVVEYRFSFAEEEFYEQNPEARMMVRFADDPLWGKR